MNYIPALPQTKMEKLAGNVSLVNMNIAGTPTATPVTPTKTKPTKCTKKVVKLDGLSIFRQKLEEVDESTHILSTRVATFVEACRSTVLGPCHAVSKCGGKGSCSEFIPHWSRSRLPFISLIHELQLVRAVQLRKRARLLQAMAGREEIHLRPSDPFFFDS